MHQFIIKQNIGFHLYWFSSFNGRIHLIGGVSREKTEKTVFAKIEEQLIAHIFIEIPLEIQWKFVSLDLYRYYWFLHLFH